MKSIKNSKFKNTGILYELLVRQVASDVLSNKDQSNAVSLIKKYFNPSTELGKELNLYNSFSNTSNLSEVKASKFIDIVIEKRKKINGAEIAKQKYNLIKEMRDLYDLNLMLKTKIPTYKTHASLYKIFLHETHAKGQLIDDVNDLMNCRFTLMEQLMSTSKPIKVKKEEDKALTEYKKQDEDLRLYIFKILIEKFNKKYSSLNEKQKTLLRHYINDMSGNKELREFVDSEIPLIRSALVKKINEVDNKIIQIKLQEVVNQLNKIKIEGDVKDNQITSLLIAYEICKELEK